MKKELTAIDLSAVSDADITREHNRRLAARRDSSKAGRRKKLQPCHKCGAQLGTRELRAHIKGCIPPAKFFIPAPTGTGRTIAAGHAEYVTAEGVRLAWSGRGMPLPNIGATVNVTMNNLGLATVMGYFSEGGYLGIMTRLHNPPEWLKKQKQQRLARKNDPQWVKDGIGCQFGTEISPINSGRARRPA
jgi:hypothetical protein